jgi:hypothetical protein
MAKKTAKPPPEPHAPEMQPAWSAYQRGDFRAARQKAKALLAAGAPEPAKDEARELIQRTNLEPGVVLTLVAMTLAIVGIVLALALR